MQGQCLCGKTVFSFELINHDVHACHCSICRKQTSDANMTIDIEAGSLKFVKDSNLSIYASSEWAERGFCNHCGTSLFWRMKDQSYGNINVFAIDHILPDLNFNTEVYIDHKPDFYAFKNETQKLTKAEVIALFST